MISGIKKFLVTKLVELAHKLTDCGMLSILQHGNSLSASNTFVALGNTKFLFESMPTGLSDVLKNATKLFKSHSIGERMLYQYLRTYIDALCEFGFFDEENMIIVEVLKKIIDKAQKTGKHDVAYAIYLGLFMVSSKELNEAMKSEINNPKSEDKKSKKKEKIDMIKKTIADLEGSIKKETKKPKKK